MEKTTEKSNIDPLQTLGDGGRFSEVLIYSVLSVLLKQNTWVGFRPVHGTG